MHEELSAPTTVHQSSSPKGGSGDPASNAHWERFITLDCHVEKRSFIYIPTTITECASSTQPHSISK